jgi:hypothetical protein
MFRLENGVVKKLGTVGAFDFAFDATDIYFTERYSSGNASVWRLAKTGGAATPIAVTGGAFANGLALDGGGRGSTISRSVHLVQEPRPSSTWRKWPPE